MKKTSQIRVVISFESPDGESVEHETVLDVAQEEVEQLDKCEQHVLDSAYEAMRGALSKQFSNLSKKS